MNFAAKIMLWGKSRNLFEGSGVFFPGFSLCIKTGVLLEIASHVAGLSSRAAQPGTRNSLDSLRLMYFLWLFLDFFREEVYLDRQQVDVIFEIAIFLVNFSNESVFVLQILVEFG